MVRLRLDRDAIWGTFLFLATSILNLSLLSKTYVFEGLARAMPIELGRFRNLFDGNYILYGFAGWCFHQLLSSITNLTAVQSLQLLDALIGAAGIWLFFRLLRKIGAEITLAALGAVVLATTLGYWRWSTDAEDYIFSTFLLIVNFYFLIDYSLRRKPRPAILGILHALAVGGHIVNTVFAPVVVWFIVRANPGKWRRPVAEYALSALAAALLAYSVALSIVQPANFSEAMRWFWGSAASPAGVSFGGGHSLWKLLLWIKTSLNALTSLSPAFITPGWSVAPGLLWIARLLTVILLAALAFDSRRLSREGRTILVGCLIWLGAYALVFTSWQPDTLVYRTTDLPPFCLLLVLSARRLAKPGVALLGVLSLTLSLGNLGAEILPRSFASNNPDLARMAFIQDHTEPSDWVTGGGGRDELYLPFFAQRKPLVVDRFRADPARLMKFAVDANKRGERIFVTSGTLEDPFWRDFFARASLNSIARDASGFVLYRLGENSGVRQQKRTSL